MSKQVAKIVVRSPRGYCFVRKRSPGHPKKDGLLELFGGGVEPRDRHGQTLDAVEVAAMTRELREEEASGTLAALFEERVASHLLGAPVRVVVAGDPHAVFHIDVSLEAASLIRASPEEGRGVAWQDASQVEDPKRLRAALERFTPKTRRIFAALKMI